MKKLLILGLSVSGLLLGTAALRAADAKVTLSGEGKCAKCSLKEEGVKECQNALVVDDAGKKVTYYFEKNKVSDDFHKNICTSVKKVKAVGTVKEVGGKKMFTAIEVNVIDK